MRNAYLRLNNERFIQRGDSARQYIYYYGGYCVKSKHASCHSLKPKCHLTSATGYAMIWVLRNSVQFHGTLRCQASSSSNKLLLFKRSKYLPIGSASRVARQCDGTHVAPNLAPCSWPTTLHRSRCRTRSNLSHKGKENDHRIDLLNSRCFSAALSTRSGHGSDHTPIAVPRSILTVSQADRAALMPVSHC